MPNNSHQGPQSKRNQYSPTSSRKEGGITFASALVGGEGLQHLPHLGAQRASGQPPPAPLSPLWTWLRRAPMPTPWVTGAGRGRGNNSRWERAAAQLEAEEQREVTAVRRGKGREEGGADLDRTVDKFFGDVDTSTGRE
jgi:hypothetical protein